MYHLLTQNELLHFPYSMVCYKGSNNKQMISTCRRHTCSYTVTVLCSSWNDEHAILILILQCQMFSISMILTVTFRHAWIIHHLIMTNIMWLRFNQSTKQLTVGHMTTDSDRFSHHSYTLFTSDRKKIITFKINMLPVHSLVLSSTTYPVRHVMQSNAEGPVQPSHDWWQATETKHTYFLYFYLYSNICNRNQSFC